MESAGAAVNRISYAAPSRTGPAEIAAQCAPNTSFMRRSTASPWTETSVYSVTLPSGSRTTSAMARILPRNARRPSAQVEDDRQTHAQGARLQSRGKRHLPEPVHRLEGGLVEQPVGRRGGDRGLADRA